MRKIIILLISILSLSGVFLYNYYNIHLNKSKELLYIDKSLELKAELNKLIVQKQDTTASLTYVLSRKRNVIEALTEKNRNILNCKEILSNIVEMSGYRNLWIQIVDKDGYSFYRSWTPKTGDYVASVRIDIANMIKTPKPMNTISVGKFDMTFKTIYPVYNDGKFIGMIEMISHFNSIAKILTSMNIEPVMILNEDYTKRIIKPFSGLFIAKDYIANLNASPILIKKIEKHGVKKFMNIKDFMIFEDYLVTTLPIPDMNNNPMDYQVLFYKLNKLNTKEINQYKINFLLVIIAFILFISFLIFILINKNHLLELNTKVKIKTKDLVKQKRVLKSLVDAYDKDVIFSRTDLNGIIVHTSDAFCKISGYSREEMMGHSHNINRHPDMPKSFFKNLWSELQQEHSVVAEVKNRRKDGSYYWALSKFNIDYDSDGKHIGYSAVREDITAQKEVEHLQHEIEETQKEVVFTMGAIGESRSKETGNHVKRVAEYSKLLALLYGLDEKESEMLKQASPMHDIGKVGIPDAILNKPARFTPEEREIMNTHVTLGYNMLNVSERPLLKTAAIVAYQHHEKWDGTGYPNNLKGENIHIYGRITALADVFDALGSDRVYKKAWSDEKIFKLFKEERGTHFDPQLVDIFFDNLDEFLKIRDRFKDVV